MLKHGLLRIISDYRFEILEQYSTEVEYFIKTKFEDFKKRAEEATKGLPEEEQQEYYDYFYDDLVLVRDDFPSILRYTTITSTYSALEQSLMRIHYQKSKDKQGYKKYKKYNSDIDAVIQYIRNEMGVDIPTNSAELRFIKN